MNRLQKDHSNGTDAMDAREFPAEAFDYNADVTSEAVSTLRERAKSKLGNRDKWKQIDGFGQVLPAA